MSVTNYNMNWQPSWLSVMQCYSLSLSLYSRGGRNMVTVSLDYSVLIFDIWSHCVAACSLYWECVSPGVGMVYGSMVGVIEGESSSVGSHQTQCWLSVFVCYDGRHCHTARYPAPPGINNTSSHQATAQTTGDTARPRPVRRRILREIPPLIPHIFPHYQSDGAG